MRLEELLEVEAPQTKACDYVRCVDLNILRPAHRRLSLRALNWPDIAHPHSSEQIRSERNVKHQGP